MGELSGDELVLAILFVWLDGEKQREILKLLNIEVEEGRK